MFIRTIFSYWINYLLSRKKIYKWSSYKKANLKISENEIIQRINERNKARKNNNFELADKIRNELFENGILIEDKDDTTSWKYK